MVSKYLVFILTEEKPKTFVWDVCTKTYLDTIGEIRWYAQWRQYCFFPEYDCVFSGGCLREIVNFMDEQMEGRKK